MKISLRDRQTIFARWSLIEISIVCILLILASNGSFVLAGTFWLKSMIAVLIFLLLALNSAVAEYPDAKTGQKKYIFWTFALMILSADLSLGMKKKLAIAAALLGDPQIVFLDEALNGVDVESAFHIKYFLKERVAKGTTVILSTHVLEVVEKICDRYLVLKNGRIIADLDARELKRSGYRKKFKDLEHYVISLLK